MTTPIQDKLIHAYDLMLERVHATIERAEKEAIPNIEEQLKVAQQKAIELGELSKEEAEKVSQYLKRDLQDISEYMQETQSQFSDWLTFEASILESKMFDWLNLVADQTKVQWNQFNEQARKSQQYHSGEITGPGTLECTACQQLLHFKKTGHIPPCPKCHGTEFKRHKKES